MTLHFHSTVPVAPLAVKNTNSCFLRFFVRSVPRFRSLMLTPMSLHPMEYKAGRYPVDYSLLSVHGWII